MNIPSLIMATLLSMLPLLPAVAQREYIFVEYNCENLFDTRRDTLKDDSEFQPESQRTWTFHRYWSKLNGIGRAIQQCGGSGKQWRLPDMVALVEVENDSVLHDLTRRSMLHGAGYRYVVTDSPDQRGIDVALLYNPLTVRLLSVDTMRIERIAGQRPTRDVLCAQVMLHSGDSMYVFVVHAPSRGHTDAYRRHVARTVIDRIGEIRRQSPDAAILISGDFNDYTYSASLRMFAEAGFKDVSEKAVGLNHPDEVCGTYRFRGVWESLDHILMSSNIIQRQFPDGITPDRCHIMDADWVLEKDKAGNYRPRRTYLGTYYHGGVSDHLPLVLRLKF